MITVDDIKMLVEAHASVRAELNKNEPRAAAAITCDALNWLVNQGSFWEGLRDLSVPLQENVARVAAVLKNLTDFIDAECTIFDKLGLDPPVTEPIVCAVYADMGVLQQIDLDNITATGFANLRQHVREAASLVCGQRKNAFMRGVDWVVSWKGARILAGAGVTGANALALGTTFLVAHPLTPVAASVSTASVTVGSALMKGNAFGLLDLLKPKG